MNTVLLLFIILCYCSCCTRYYNNEYNYFNYCKQLQSGTILKMRTRRLLKMIAGDIKSVIILDIFLQYSVLEVKEQDHIISKLNNIIIEHHFQQFTGIT